jgi:Arc/MetJ family transcription regulator
MKTTIEIADALLEQAKKWAAKEDTTVKALVEEGLRRILGEREKGKKFRLRKATFKGKGLQPGVSEGSWEAIRELIYKERGA